MKRILTKTLCFTLLILISLMPVAFAATSLESIHSAKNITELDAAMSNASELSGEVGRMNELKNYEKNRILTGLMIRKKYQPDMASFKELFEAEYTAATTYAKFEEGYPYTTGESGNGAYIVVKTDMDCYVYIVAMPDNIKGGLTSEYDLKMFYRADNNQYKKKVWVQGGLETKITVSCAAWGNGQKYRAYACLDVDGNKSEFCEVKYQVNDYRYYWDLEYLYRMCIWDFYNLNLMSYQDVSYTCEIITEYPFWVRYNDLCGVYDKNGEYETIKRIRHLKYFSAKQINTSVTFSDGTTCTDTFYIAPY